VKGITLLKQQNDVTELMCYNATVVCMVSVLLPSTTRSCDPETSFQTTNQIYHSYQV